MSHIFYNKLVENRLSCCAQSKPFTQLIFLRILLGIVAYDTFGQLVFNVKINVDELKKNIRAKTIAIKQIYMKIQRTSETHSSKEIKVKQHINTEDFCLFDGNKFSVL